MKKLIISLVIILIFYTGYCQTSYYDGLSLGKLVVNKTDTVRDPANPALKIKHTTTSFNADYIDSIFKILAAYTDSANGKPFTTYLNIKGEYLNNPFLKGYVNGMLQGNGDKVSQSSTSPVPSFLGGITIPNDVLIGVTDWIVKHAKSELSISFFSKFYDIINKYKDLQTVFPKTYERLKTIGDEIYDYNSYLKNLKEDFENDLSQLDKNLPSIIDNDSTFFDQHPAMKATLRSAFYIVKAIADSVHPGDILNEYPDYLLDSLNMNWKSSVQTLQLLSASLKNTNTDTNAYWVNAKQVKTLVSDSVAFKIYLGLIYQEAKNKYGNIKFNNTVSLVRILDTVANHYSKLYSAYSGFIKGFSQNALNLDRMIRNYQKPENDSLALIQYYNYFNTTIDFLQYSTEILKLPYVDKLLPHLADSLKDYFDVLHSAASLVYNVKRHKYIPAINNAVSIYDIILTKHVSTTSETTSSLAAVDTKKGLLKYGSFMAAIVDAKNDTDIENVIENFALPVGSSRIKRESSFNVALNAYAGLYVGNEVIKGVDIGNKPLSRINAYGVTAPIGVSINFGQRKWLFGLQKGGHWSYSLFLSVVDLGAVAAYRFTNDSVSQVPVVQLKDIFSPGAFLSIGIPKCPISLNFGAQLGPNLRNVDHTSAIYVDASNKTYVRYSFSLCVDLPVLNFYTSSR